MEEQEKQEGNATVQTAAPVKDTPYSAIYDVNELIKEQEEKSRQEQAAQSKIIKANNLVNAFATLIDAAGAANHGNVKVRENNPFLLQAMQKREAARVNGQNTVQSIKDYDISNKVKQWQAEEQARRQKENIEAETAAKQGLLNQQHKDTMAEIAEEAKYKQQQIEAQNQGRSSLQAQKDNAKYASSTTSTRTGTSGGEEDKNVLKIYPSSSMNEEDAIYIDKPALSSKIGPFQDWYVANVSPLGFTIPKNDDEYRAMVLRYPAFWGKYIPEVFTEEELTPRPMTALESRNLTEYEEERKKLVSKYMKANRQKRKNNIAEKLTELDNTFPDAAKYLKEKEEQNKNALDEYAANM